MKTFLSLFYTSTFVALFLLVNPLNIYAQEIQEVRFVEQGDTLAVHFDLSGDPSKWYDIEVQVVENINGKIRFLLPEKGTLIGDYISIAAGPDKLIQWLFGLDPQIENTDNVFLNLIPKEGKFVPKPPTKEKETIAQVEVVEEITTEETNEAKSEIKTLTDKEKKQKAKLIEKKKIQAEKENRKKQKALAKAAKKQEKPIETAVINTEEHLHQTEQVTTNESEETLNTEASSVEETVIENNDTVLLASEQFIKVRKSKRQLFAPKAIPKDAKVWETIYSVGTNTGNETNVVAFSLDQLIMEKNAAKRPQIILKKKPENPFLMDARIALGLMPQDGELPQGVVPSMPLIFIGDLAKTKSRIGLTGNLKTAVAPPTPLKGKHKRALKQKEKANIASAKRQAKVDAIAAKKQAKIDKKKARKEKERPFWDLFKKVNKDYVPETQKAPYSKYSRWREKQ